LRRINNIDIFLHKIPKRINEAKIKAIHKISKRKDLENIIVTKKYSISYQRLGPTQCIKFQREKILRHP